MGQSQRALGWMQRIVGYDADQDLQHKAGLCLHCTIPNALRRCQRLAVFCSFCCMHHHFSHHFPRISSLRLVCCSVASGRYAAQQGTGQLPFSSTIHVTQSLPWMNWMPKLAPRGVQTSGNHFIWNVRLELHTVVGGYVSGSNGCGETRTVRDWLF